MAKITDFEAISKYLFLSRYGYKKEVALLGIETPYILDVLLSTEAGKISVFLKDENQLLSLQKRYPAAPIEFFGQNQFQEAKRRYDLIYLSEEIFFLRFKNRLPDIKTALKTDGVLITALHNIYAESVLATLDNQNWAPSQPFELIDFTGALNKSFSHVFLFGRVPILGYAFDDFEKVDLPLPQAIESTLVTEKRGEPIEYIAVCTDNKNYLKRPSFWVQLPYEIIVKKIKALQAKLAGTDLKESPGQPAASEPEDGLFPFAAIAQPLTPQIADKIVPPEAVPPGKRMTPRSLFSSKLKPLGLSGHGFEKALAQALSGASSFLKRSQGKNQLSYFKRLADPENPGIDAAEIKKLQSELSFQTDALTKLRHEKELVKQQISDRDNEAAKLKEENQHYLEQIKELEAAIDQARELNEGQRINLTQDLEKQIERLTWDVRLNGDNLDKLKESEAILSKENKKLGKENEKIKVENKGLREDIKELKAILAEFEEHYNTIRLELTEKNEHLQQRTEDQTTCQKEYYQLKEAYVDEKNRSAGQIKDLEKRLELKEAEVVEYRTEYDKLRQELLQKADQIGLAKESEEFLTQTHQETGAENQKLKEEIVWLKVQNQGLIQSQQEQQAIAARKLAEVSVETPETKHFKETAPPLAEPRDQSQLLEASRKEFHENLEKLEQLWKDKYHRLKEELKQKEKQLENLQKKKR